MGQQISVSKAARLLGVKRSELNKRLAAAEIETFEGDVDYEKIKCIAPALGLNQPELDRIRHIRENAAYTEPENLDLPLEDLKDRIIHLSHRVEIEADTAREYHEIIENIATKLGELQTSDSEERRKIGFELCEWLRKSVAEE
jgi:CDP-4-dehydro-6-deoxyglucose reductase, E3